MKRELQSMIENHSGVITNNSSVDGLRAFPFDPGYSAAKHGVLGLTKSAALQYAEEGIRINAICPGWVETPPVQRLVNEGFVKKDILLTHQPIKRFGQPEEIADLVLWLSSSAASFMTGATLPIDGGYTAV